MKTVSTKSELKRAIEQKQFPIKCVGEIAQQLKKNKKRSNASKIGGAALMVAGIAAIPFTGGASAAGVAAGAMGLTIGSVVISTAELAILVGGGIALVGVLKGRKVRLGPDGGVYIE